MNIFDQNNIFTILIHNLQTAWPTNNLVQFLSSVDNFQINAGNFKIAHKTC